MTTAADLARFAEIWRNVDEMTERQQSRLFSLFGPIPRTREMKRRFLFRLLYNPVTAEKVFAKIEAIRREDG